MAEIGETQTGDMPAHARTWSGFKAMMFWGAIGAFAIGFFVVFLIAPHK